MQHVFWMIPGKLAGRSGPNLDPWNVDDLKAGGIDSILTVNEGPAVVPEEFHRRGMGYARISFSRNAPPIPGDLEICLEALPKAYAFLSDEIDSGRSVMVHCTSGKDRTGLLLAYYLMRTMEIGAEDAVRQVRIVRPIALSAEGWEEFGLEILERLRDFEGRY